MLDGVSNFVFGPVHRIWLKFSRNQISVKVGFAGVMLATLPFLHKLATLDHIAKSRLTKCLSGFLPKLTDGGLGKSFTGLNSATGKDPPWRKFSLGVEP